jgi:hypothetical protein
MMHKYDPDNSRSLSLDEYLRACLFLQVGLSGCWARPCSRRVLHDSLPGEQALEPRQLPRPQTASRTFSAFDQQRRNNINLNFNQFVYACSHVS